MSLIKIKYLSEKEKNIQLLVTSVRVHWQICANYQHADCTMILNERMTHHS